MSLPQEQEFEQRIGQIEHLVDRIEGWPDQEARSVAQELLQATLDLHGAGLDRILTMIEELGEPGFALLNRLSQDELVSNLLLLHDLHPISLETRVTQALDKVRPYLGSHGGNVELIDVDNGLIHLRLQGSCNGCQSSAVTLKLAIEEAIHEYAPDAAGMVVEGVVEPKPRPPSNFIPLSQVQRPPKRSAESPSTEPTYIKQEAEMGGARWENIGSVSSLASGSTRVMEVAGENVLLCRLDETFYVYRNACPGCGESLSGARLKLTTLACQVCHNSYDVMRAGRCLDRPELHLEPLPLLVEQGQAKIALAGARETALIDV